MLFTFLLPSLVAFLTERSTRRRFHHMYCGFREEKGGKKYIVMCEVKEVRFVTPWQMRQ